MKAKISVSVNNYCWNSWHWRVWPRSMGPVYMELDPLELPRGHSIKRSRISTYCGQAGCRQEQPHCPWLLQPRREGERCHRCTSCSFLPVVWSELFSLSWEDVEWAVGFLLSCFTKNCFKNSLCILCNFAKQKFSILI